MTAIKDAVVSKLYRGIDPYSFFLPDPEKVDFQGWGSNHPWLTTSIEESKSKTIIEIGAWKGCSSITMASALKRLGRNGVVISIDTWLGSEEHWIEDSLYASLQIRRGIPDLQSTFMNNIIASDLTGYVIPFPIDSINGARVVSRLGISADMIHIDAGHDQISVEADIRSWWPVLNEGGILIMDDYYPINDPSHPGAWPGVRTAVDSFVSNYGLAIENTNGKARIYKTTAG
jgi:hypothetical protein